MSPGGEIAGSAGIDLQQGAYRVRQAVGEHDLRAAFRLRFSVFNLELKEGLESASQTGLDIDEFDPVCDHLIVERVGTDQVVGTYRLQSGLMAKANLGYYGEREFSFEPYESIRANSLSLVGHAFIANTAPPTSCTCCGEASHNMRCAVGGAISWGALRSRPRMRRMGLRSTMLYANTIQYPHCARSLS